MSPQCSLTVGDWPSKYKVAWVPWARNDLEGAYDNGKDLDADPALEGWFDLSCGIA